MNGILVADDDIHRPAKDYSGTSWDSSRGAWRASTRSRGKTITVGWYLDRDAAAEAARAARNKPKGRPGKAASLLVACKQGEPFQINGKPVRSVLIDGAPWSLANDLRSALGLTGATWFEMAKVATSDKRSLSRREAPFLFDGRGGPSCTVVSPAGRQALEALAERRASRIRRRTVRPILVEGDTAVVPLTMGYEAVIASADLHLVEGRNWSAKPHGRKVLAMGNFKRPDGRFHTRPMSALPLSQEPVVRLKGNAPREPDDAPGAA
ncbi:hypothetical protein V5F77_20620 [Xanthobacter sp. DSM 24535]|uniref:hypothetical protein n=1 Tax=Roseixanthobacter psychrophilus TaxID=3119917 RepID=UPI00372B02BD